MGLDIVTNIMAQDASNNLAINESNMQNSLQKLSSGYQINKAADDASGLVISQHLQAQIGGFQQAQANTQSAINVVQTADGALNEVGTILQRINTLAVESANTSATDSTAQQAAQSEVQQSLESLVNIAQTTVYGNNQLLVNGTFGTVNYTFQVGADNTSASQVAFSVTALNLANLGLVSDSLTLPSGGSSNISSITAAGLGVNAAATFSTVAGTNASFQGTIALTSGSFATGSSGLSFNLNVNGSSIAVTFAASATYSLASFAQVITTALANAGLATTALNITYQGSGTATATFDITDATGGAAGTLSLTATTSANLTSLGLNASSYTGTDANVYINGTSFDITNAQNQAGTLTLTQAGNAYSLVLTSALGTQGAFTGTAEYNGYADVNKVNFSVTASNAVTVINSAIQTVSAMRGTLGAYQNELQHITDNESVMVQNLQASNAQIQDTNMASQMVNFTQDQVLVQAGVSMLAQANQIPQMVLKLLG
ncbi:MAG TPA: flagellin [Acidimicrobiales bacterium]|nr:flagellin [Acidimicrobiales bacterium]